MDLEEQLTAEGRVRRRLTILRTSTHLTPTSIYSTGGTILSTSNFTRLDNIKYGSGVPATPENMIGNTTEILDVAQLAIVTIPTSGGSSTLNSSTFLNITQQANRQLCPEESDISGAIMFHGTDTLEETVRLPIAAAKTRPRLTLCRSLAWT